MRFLLVEQYPDVPAEHIAKWETADDQQKLLLFKQLIQRYKRPEIKNIEEVLRYSCNSFGIDPKENPFINFFESVASNMNITSRHESYFRKLIDMYLSGIVAEKNMDSYLCSEKSLYERSLKDFEYTVKVFETCLDPNKLKKYFKKVDDNCVDQLFDAQGRIKPAGSPQTVNDTNTIFGQVEAWSEGGENDADSAKATSKAVGPRKLSQIKKQAYDNLEKVPDSEKKEGNIVYVKALRHNPSGPRDEDMFNGFVIFQDGEWVKYLP